MDEFSPAAFPLEEVSIFCPVHIYLGPRRFDGLLDTLDIHGGTFYVLAEEPIHPGTPARALLQSESRVELVLSQADAHGGMRELRIPCQMRGIRFDEDGLYAYVGLSFLEMASEERRRLDHFIASLW